MPGDTYSIERALITGVWDNDDYTDPVFDLAQSVVNGKFRLSLTSSAARKLFYTNKIRANTLDGPLDAVFDFKITSGASEEHEELLRLTLAVACLHAFVQANWTGPDLDVKTSEVFLHPLDESSDLATKMDQIALAELSLGGEPAYHLAKIPSFLRIAQLLLAYPFKHLWSVQWWNLRVAVIHQQILDEPSGDPQHILDSLKQPSITLLEDSGLLGRFYLEEGLLEHQFSREKGAAEHFLKAANATGMVFELTGALGKRTKFQETELSQLVLLAESHLRKNDEKFKPQNHSTAVQASNVQSSMPQNLQLNDDTLLEKTEFTTLRSPENESRLSHIHPSSQPELHPIDQCILLSLCLNVRDTSPSHGITTEQMTPYISRVISHPINWSVHTMALLLRSRLEANRTRTVERSTLQLQALIDQMPTSDSSISERLLYFHCIPLPSKWEMEKELALRFLRLGVVKSAMEIFERLEMWEEVVKCWSALERPEKGIAIVRDLLEGRKAASDEILARGKDISQDRRVLQDNTREAKLWCLLGDLEPQNAVEYYRRAWSISKQTSGRAMRSLGGLYFARRNYNEAVSCLKRAVAINPLLTRSWFILGCACMRLENWEEAKAAFLRCVAIDEEDGESWNNLASMYLRMGTVKNSDITPSNNEEANDAQADAEMACSEDIDISKSIMFENKLLAFQALKHGLRFSYDNWRMWYNYMMVSMDVGELNEVCRALGRVIELTGDKSGAKAVDEDVLDRLVNAVTNAPSNIEDALGGGASKSNEGHGLYKTVTNLFEKTILSRVSTTRVFNAYARLLTWQSRWEDALKTYLDGYRLSTAGTTEKGGADVVRWRESVGQVEEIVDILRNFGPRAENYNWEMQARSILRTFIGRTKEFEDEPEWERLVALQDEFRK